MARNMTRLIRRKARKSTCYKFKNDEASYGKPYYLLILLIPQDFDFYSELVVTLYKYKILALSNVAV